MDNCRAGTIRCCVCESTDATPKFIVDGQVFVQCNGCSLVYIANYTPDGNTYETDDYFVRKHEYVQRWDEFCSMFEHLISKVMRFKQRGNFLDVGTGIGVLLHVARKHEFTVSGVEVSAWASEYARSERGLDVITGTLEDAAYPDASFDVIVINHVLEHVPAPVKLLDEAHRILKEDGVLVVGVPNIGSMMAHILRERWPSLQAREHIWHFTPKTLRRLIVQGGFQQLWFEASDNYSVKGWSPQEIARRIINKLSVITNRSEAMLLFAVKRKAQ